MHSRRQTEWTPRSNTLVMSRSNGVRANEPHPAIRLVARVSARLLFGELALVPACLIGYLFVFQDPALQIENHAFHGIIITTATLAGLVATYAAWQCHQSSGEPLLRWMTLSFLGYLLIYTLPAAFDALAHHNTQLLLFYGSVSRLVISVLMLTGLLSYPQPPAPGGWSSRAPYWLAWVGVFLGIDVLIALAANPVILASPDLRLSMEGGALVFSALNVSILMLRRMSSPPMQIYGVSVTWFALSSAAFILSRPWNPMWWLANAIFAGGFSLLSYGVIQAFRTTRSFAMVYTHDELMAQLVESMRRTESALQALQSANQKLEHLAATDPLTGAANRRKFIESVEAEIARTTRGGPPFSVLALDLDNFKWVNDRYGHQIGDKVLQEFVQACVDVIQPYDGVGRIGGEEFMVLLPHAGLDAALRVGQRVRLAIASMSFAREIESRLSITVSIGIAQFGKDGKTIDTILRAADQRLHHAKRRGRNCVVAN
jgi:two-component system cell cycle response regulator